MRALIVDDSRATRMILVRLLKGVGFADIYEADNGKDAVASLLTIGRVDVVLVDWNMPEMDGLTFVRTIRKDNNFSGMCMVMVTTETARESVIAALAAGATDYVMKPFTREGMIEKLALLGFAGHENK